MDTIIAIKMHQYNPALFKGLIQCIEYKHKRFKVSVNKDQIYFFKGVDRNQIQDEEFLFFINLETNFDFYSWINWIDHTKEDLLEIASEFCVDLSLNTFTIGSPLQLMEIPDDMYCKLMEMFLQDNLNSYVSSVELNSTTLKEALSFKPLCPFDADFVFPF